MSIVMASVALTGFTSCSDDDDDNAPAPVQKEELSAASDAVRVKIGEENRVPVSSLILSGNGEYSAYSLNPEVVDIVTGEDGQIYVQGVKNGNASLVISDAASSYLRIPVSVYTTDVMSLNNTSVALEGKMGSYLTNDDCAVVEGNGEYSIESNVTSITPSIDPETGEISIQAKATSAEYTAVLTVSDISGLTATINVTVTPTFDAFTADDLAALMAKTSNDFAYNGGQPGFAYRNTIAESTANGNIKFGFLYTSSSWWGTSTYYNCQIEYPAGTAVGTEVDGAIYYTNGSSTQTSYKGKVKLLADDATKRVAIWYNVDMDKEKIDNGYVVWIK